MNIEEILPVITALMIPSDESRNLPDGSQVEITNFLELDGVYDEVSLCLKDLSHYVKSALGWSLEELTQEQFEVLTKSHRKAMDPLLKNIGPSLLKAYYTDPVVQVQIGVGNKPPFPEGRVVHEGDLELLEPVFNRGPIFREI